jgi:hypothetical protein
MGGVDRILRGCVLAIAICGACVSCASRRAYVVMPSNIVAVARGAEGEMEGERLPERDRVFVWSRRDLHAFVDRDTLFIAYKANGTTHEKVLRYEYLLPAGVIPEKTQFLKFVATCLGDVVSHRKESGAEPQVPDRR